MTKHIIRIREFTEKMADIFLKDDALKILKRKRIIFIGDSIQRNIYQDLVTLLCKGGVTSHDVLKKKGIKRL